MKFLDNEAIIKAFNFRNACKKFDASKSISEADFKTILEAGRLSPSSFGFEPWKFLVLRDKAVRKKIYDNTWGGQDALDNASEFVVILARKNASLHPDAEYIQHIMADVQGLNEEIQKIKKDFFTSFQKDNFYIYNDEQKVFDWACKQAYIALGNMLSVAALLGLDSLPIEGFNQEKVTQILADEGLFDKNHFKVAVLCAFGVRLDDPKYAKTRQSFDEVVHFV